MNSIKRLKHLLAFVSTEERLEWIEDWIVRTMDEDDRVQAMTQLNSKKEILKHTALEKATDNDA